MSCSNLSFDALLASRPAQRFAMELRRAYANEWQLPALKCDAAAVRPWIDAGKQAWERRAKAGPT